MNALFAVFKLRANRNFALDGQGDILGLLIINSDDHVGMGLIGNNEAHCELSVH